MNKLFFAVCFAGVSLVASAAIPPEVASCTNFVTCKATVRTAFSKAFSQAFASGDMKEAGALLEHLKKGPQGLATFPLWDGAAWCFVDDAAKFAKKKPAEQAELMAGFREGGTTFGLWDAPMTKGGKPQIVLTRLREALGILDMMPGDLGTELEWKRLRTGFSYVNKIGGDAERKAFAPRIEKFVFETVPDAGRNSTNSLRDAVATLFDYRFRRMEWYEAIALAEELKAKRTNAFGDFANRLTAYAYVAACCARDEKLEAKYAAQVDAVPATAAALEDYRALATLLQRNFGNSAATWSRLDARVAKFAKMQCPTDDVRLLYLQSVGLVKINLGELDEAMKAYREMRAIRPAFTSYQAFRDTYRRILEVKKGYAFLEEVLEDGLKLNPADMGLKYSLVRTCLAVGKSDRVASLAAELATNAPPKWIDKRTGDPRFNARVMAARATAKDPEDFARAVKALKPMTDGDEAFFRAVRTVAKELFTIRADQPNYPYLMALARLTGEMLHPEERLAYTCRFMKDAPRTADGALRSGLFDKLPLENRMAQYKVYSNIDRDKELKLLKSNEKPHLAADVPGKEGGVAVACDATGVHIYVRLNDPDAGKALAGCARGANAEYVIMTGTDAQWHWNSISIAEPQGLPIVPEWGSVWKGFKIGEEYIRSDAVATETCYAFHIFVPWVLAYTTLPPDGGDWSLVLCAGWAGQFGALGGGSVHEVGRGMRIAFDLSKDDLAAIRFGCLRQAAAEYKKVRDKWENTDFWSDPHLGDEKFYAEVVKPLVARLDEVVKPLMDGTLPSEEVDACFAAHAEELADFRLTLDALRAKWITKRLFGE